MTRSKEVVVDEEIISGRIRIGRAGECSDTYKNGMERCSVRENLAATDWLVVGPNRRAVGEVHVDDILVAGLIFDR